jgi:glyoxylase-like metal-dependent hydrolase (beta-lactamase superfamily II)
MNFHTEPEPLRGAAHPIAPGIRRLVANNPGGMTYWGTNTYLIDASDGILVLDPGPDDPAHVAAVLEASNGAVVGIILSHTHADHLGATAALKAATGAPTFGWHAPASSGFLPDRPLHDHDCVGVWQALHTPGHASDHLCFAGPDGVLFSADHVMGWSSSIVPPPDGNMKAYFNSLHRLLERQDRLYLPGHGPVLTEPQAFTADLLHHRQTRERQIIAALDSMPQTAWSLVERLYGKIDNKLRRAAELNVIAHVEKLVEEGSAHQRGDGWALANA